MKSKFSKLYILIIYIIMNDRIDEMKEIIQQIKPHSGIVTLQYRDLILQLDCGGYSPDIFILFFI